MVDELELLMVGMLEKKLVEWKAQPLDTMWAQKTVVLSAEWWVEWWVAHWAQLKEMLLVGQLVSMMALLMVELMVGYWDTQMEPKME
jgi:hypothetical protein